MLFKRKPPVKAWIIDPENQSITETELNSGKIDSLVCEIVGDDAESFRLDNYNNMLWFSETDTNDRYA
jgi:hypothetical protein